jgi:hypothetical protein
MKIVSILILSVCFCAANAADFIRAELKLADGKLLKGFATFPDKPNDKAILFKNKENAEAISYPSENLKTLVYFFDDGKVEFDRIMIYPSLLNGKKMAGPYWIEVVERGYATLYYALREGSTVVRSGVSSMTSADKFWYCMRTGEEAAKVISWVIGTVNANETFRREGQKYFKDYPELAAKIKDKTYRYDSIVEAVKEYNKWIKQEAKPGS